jgi:hypothetical protein
VESSNPTVSPELWAATRAGARAGRGFRYQDAVAAQLAARGWRDEGWSAVIPEGVDDIALHGNDSSWLVQAKSRHDPRGRFATAEIADHLSKAVRGFDDDDFAFDQTRIALIIERAAEEIGESGWNASLAEDASAATLLAPLLDEAAEAIGKTGLELLARCHLVHVLNPMDDCTAIIAEGSGALDAAARLAAHALRVEMGDLSDANYLAPADHPAAMNASGVQTILDRLFKLVDPTAVHPAISAGLCEVVSFAPTADPNFYQGVDATSGHVAAGLVLERPALTASILEGLDRRRCALVSGPSGSGKSAAAWLAAGEVRHAVRWYRVRRLAPDQAIALIALARALEASSDRPVGFVLDDLGRDLVGGWDVLVEDLKHEPGLLLLGTIREEDLFLVGNLGSVALSRPELDEVLAARLLSALSSEGLAFSHWVEPFELSQGLLLEYVHLLTSGQRLQETLDQQVRRRIAEKRDDELAILRAVCAVSRFGGAADGGRLRDRLGLSEIDFSRALLRLVDEHAVRIGEDKSLGGLHEIRSRGLHDALARMLTRTTDDEMAETIAIARATDFAGLIPRLMRQDDVTDAPMIGALARRIGELATPDVTRILYGLGLTMCDRIAKIWCGICKEAEIEDRFAAMAFTFALLDKPLDIPQLTRFNAAIKRRDELLQEDLRTDVLGKVGAGASFAFSTLADYHEFAAAIVPLAFVRGSPSLTMLADCDLAQTPIEEALEVLLTVREFGVPAASQLADALGGTAGLLERIHEEVDWVTRPEITVEDGEKVVRSNLRLVSALVTKDLNEEAVRHCTRLAAAVPDADVLACDVVGWDGALAGFQGMTLVTKRLSRETVTIAAPVRTAWNRAMLRAIQRNYGAPTETGRASALATALGEVADLLSDAAEAYCRGGGTSTDLNLKLTIQALLNTFIRSPAVRETARSALDQGEYSHNDKAHDFVTALTALAGKLVSSEIERPLFEAQEAAELARTAEELQSEHLWRWIADPPIAAIARCAEILRDLRAVFGDAFREPDGFRSSRLRAQRSSAKNRTLPRFARDAVARAEACAAAMSDEAARLFAAGGYDVMVAQRPLDKIDALYWPPVEHVVLVRVGHLIHYLQEAEALTAIARRLPGHYRLTFAPIREDFVVSAFAVRMMELFIPDADFAKNWAGHLPLPLLHDEATAALAAALSSLTDLSGLVANADRDLNSSELAYAQTRIDEMRERVAGLQEVRQIDNDGDVTQACQFIATILDRLAGEFAPGFTGERVSAEFAKLANGEPSAFTSETALYRLALLERDIAKAAAARDGYIYPDPDMLGPPAIRDEMC